MMKHSTNAGFSDARFSKAAARYAFAGPFYIFRIDFT